MNTLNPLEDPGWDDQLREIPGSLIFHASGWIRTLNNAYGFQPCFAASGAGGFWPIMEVKSRLTGKRGVSLPFTDCAHPLPADQDMDESFHERIVPLAQSRGWKYYECRCDHDRSTLPVSASYFGHRLNLDQSEENLRKGLKNIFKRNLKKAEHEGVEVRAEMSLDAIRTFYRLNCITRKKHGLPPQPYNFFREMHDNLVARGMASTVLGYVDGKAVAGALYLLWNKDVIYKYGASDPAYLSCRANHLVMWEAIKQFARQGYRQMTFGRTDRDHEGLRTFKLGWGTEEYTIQYHRYDTGRSQFVQALPRVNGWHNGIFERLPMPFLRLVGKVLYKHMG